MKSEAQELHTAMFLSSQTSVHWKSKSRTWVTVDSRPFGVTIK